MKRILSACLEQTIQFQPKENQDCGPALEEARAEYARYRSLLERNRIRFQVVEETALPDGSILIRVRKQCNHYEIGDYFD